jgi:hypothetical protein
MTGGHNLLSDDGRGNPKGAIVQTSGNIPQIERDEDVR